MNSKKSTKTKNARQNRILSDNIDQELWKVILTKIRSSNPKAIIKDCSIKGDEAQIEFKIPQIDDRFTQKLDATLDPNEKSEFEKFTENYGYTPYESKDLCDQKYPLEIERKPNAIEFYIPTEDPMDTQTKNKNQNETRHIIGVTSASIVVGLIPLINIAILLEFLRQATDKTNTFNNEEMSAAIGFTIGTIVSYAIPLVFFFI
jgi:hypothetical protein